MDDLIQVWTDGGCRSNPGPGAWAFVVKGIGLEHDDSGFLEQTTNNCAEYTALIKALEFLNATMQSKHITIRSDSELMVNQVNGVYDVKTPTLLPLFERAYDLLAELNENNAVVVTHVRREFNKEADALCNVVQDAHGVVCERRKEKKCLQN